MRSSVFDQALQTRRLARRPPPPQKTRHALGTPDALLRARWRERSSQTDALAFMPGSDIASRRGIPIAPATIEGALLPCSAHIEAGCPLGGPIRPSERRPDRSAIPAGGVKALSCSGSYQRAPLSRWRSWARSDGTPTRRSSRSEAIGQGQDHRSRRARPLRYFRTRKRIA
jgi:hypothetical protein